jgi:hypothetical protein
MRRKNTLAIVAISLGGALLAAAPASATTPNPAPGLNYSMNNTLNGLPGNPALTAAPACSNPGVEDHFTTRQLLLIELEICCHWFLERRKHEWRPK